MTRPTFTLPLLTGEPAASPAWHGFTAADLPGALAAPEPDAPQGEYADTPVPMPAAVIGETHTHRPVELLAPAGGPDAAFAAFHFGADAIYLGLKKFSARAEAENFTLEELSEVVAYAHALPTPRRVFVTINTLIRNDELPELVDTLARLDEMGVNAVIVQDLGVYALIRRHFPRLELHASTQLAVHNRAGADALHRLGFQRVVLARELTFEEVHDITVESAIETEVFIHGALCYSYSGLCLFSSQTLGRSGNRGKCAYSCRDAFSVEGAPLTLRDGSATRRDPTTGFPFSMKDLALPDHVPALRSAGVSCFKIEGRKKSPLYVATATDYYRKLIDDRLEETDRAAHESDLQAAFGRPWTRLFIDSHKDKEVADRDLVGHRGTVIGRIESIHGDHRSRRLRFRTMRSVERYDGLQIDIPVLGKPYGFGVRRMWRLGGRYPELVIEVSAGTLVDVELPTDHPELPVGAPVYCASSQAVKRAYRHDRPKPGLYRCRTPVDIDLHLSEHELTATGRTVRPARCLSRSLAGPFPEARDPSAIAEAAHSAFEKLGDTSLSLAGFVLHNPQGRFVPVSRLNQLRRDLATAIEEALTQEHGKRTSALLNETCPEYSPPPRTRSFLWNIKVDRIGFLDAFTAEDWRDVDEVVIDIARDHAMLLGERLEQLAGTIGRQRIRLALPAVTRKWEERGLLNKITRLREAGWRRWESANLSAWSYLGLDPTSSHTGEIDLATDWSVYVLNRVAARQLLDMGVTRFALSPEDGLQNIRPLFAEFTDRAVLIVYQDTPLFMAESCAYANLIGGCPGKANCSFESMQMESSHGEKVTAIDYHCRTIVLNQGPFCLSPRLPELARAGAVSLRADFIYRKYDPAQVAERWRAVRAGRVVAGGHAANFDRGVL